MLAVRRWRELVTDREKWRGIVRQAKAHSGLYLQRKKKKKTKKKNSNIQLYSDRMSVLLCVSKLLREQTGIGLHVWCLRHVASTVSSNVAASGH